MSAFIDAHLTELYNLAHQLRSNVGVTYDWTVSQTAPPTLYNIGAMTEPAIEAAIRQAKGTWQGLPYDLSNLVPIDVLSSYAYNHGPNAGIWPLPAQPAAPTAAQPVIVPLAGGGSIQLPAGSTAADIAAALANEAYVSSLATSKPLPAPASFAPPAPPAPAATITVNHYAPRVQLQNVTTGNPGVIVAGRDSWKLSITGAAPNVPVQLTARKDAGPSSSSSFGNTDAGGNWTLQGSSTTADIGTWAQQWTAGSDSAGTLSFSIVGPDAVNPPLTPPQTTLPPDITAGPDGTGSTPSPAGAIATATTAAAHIPLWVWGAGAAAALFFFGGGRKR